MDAGKEGKTKPVVNQPACDSNFSAPLLHNDSLAIASGRLCLRMHIGVEEYTDAKLLLGRRNVLIERPVGFCRRLNAQGRYRKQHGCRDQECTHISSCRRALTSSTRRFPED
jgi:hypothetical protein